jgi:hypothetical protein
MDAVIDGVWEEVRLVENLDERKGMKQENL